MKRHPFELDSDDGQEACAHKKKDACCKNPVQDSISTGMTFDHAAVGSMLFNHADWLTLIARVHPFNERMRNDNNYPHTEKEWQEVPRYAFERRLTPGITAIAKDLHLILVRRL